MIEIINRYTKAILYSSASTDVIARAVSKAIESGANLSEADLSGAKQRVLQIQGSQHQIVAIEHEVRIGCHVKPLAEWLAEYKTIGEVENYASAEIEEYGLHLKHIKAILGLKKRELYT